MNRCLHSLLIILSFLTSFSTYAQGPFPVLRGAAFETSFLDRNGHEIFTLPQGHSPSVAGHSSSPNFLFNSKQSLTFFRNGKLLIQAPDRRFYWINEEGETIKEFSESCFWVYPEEEGCTLIKEYEEGNNRILWHKFLDEHGEPAFGDSRFWNALPFSEGLAAVQVSKDGPWRYIDQAGDTAIAIPNNSQVILKEAHSFKDGLALCEFRPTGTYTTIYAMINQSGKAVLNVNQQFPGRTFTYPPYVADSLIVVGINSVDGSGDEIALFNHLGQKQMEYQRVIEFKKCGEKLWFLEYNEEDNTGSYHTKRYLLHADGKREPFTMELNFLKDKMTGYHQFSEWILSRGEPEISQDFLIHLPSYQERFSTADQIVGYDEELLIIKKRKTDEFRLQTYSGDILWGTSAADLTYTDITTALANKTVVRYYLMKNATDFTNGLPSLQKLTRLTIANENIQEIPKEIGDLNELQELYFSGCSSLSKLPTELGSLPALEILHVTDNRMAPGPNRRIRGLEAILNNSNSLKKVYLENVTLSDGLVEELKQLHPDLVVEDVGIIGGSLESIDE